WAGGRGIFHGDAGDLPDADWPMGIRGTGHDFRRVRAIVPPRHHRRDRARPPHPPITVAEIALLGSVHSTYPRKVIAGLAGSGTRIADPIYRAGMDAASALAPIGPGRSRPGSPHGT